MKVLSIAVKDILQQFRSSFAVGMMFVAPLLITGLLYLAFGGMGGGSDSSQASSLPVVNIQIVNQDQGLADSGVNAGQMLVDLLKSDDLSNLFALTEAQDPSAARSTVDAQQAAVAILIPSNFTQALFGQDQSVEVTLYQDPTLSFGPSLVQEVVSQFIDGFTGTQMAGFVVDEQLQRHAQALDPALRQRVQTQYSQYLQSLASQQGWGLPVDLRQPASAEKAAQDPVAVVMTSVMAGMLIFFVFFTGVNSARTILREQEEGTLARMFTTPTPLASILGGKFASVFLLLFVQSLVLVAASALVFKINWGSLPMLLLVIIALVIVAAGSGILLVSFIQNTQQIGPITGAALTFTSMAGGLFTSGFAMPKTFDMLSLIMPQGWAMRGLRLVVSGAAVSEVLLPVAVMVLMGALFFVLGVRTFRTRFA